MMREPRRRSPESSRRRRAGRRHSREQLAAAAAAAAVATPAHMASQSSLRSRADSSTSASSSTSSSLLNISRPSRFGIRAFFTRSASRRVRKRRSFRSKNASSSSVDSDLAYGKGYISRTSVERRDAQTAHHQPQQHHHQQPQHQHPYSQPQQPYVAHPQHHQDQLFGPDGRPRLERAQTDEEIRRIGRQLSDLARAENMRDLERAGRSRPSQFVAAAAALHSFNRHGNHNSTSRGIRSSRPQASDDEDWESASEDDSSSDDFDSGLIYGSVPRFSTHHLPPSVAPVPGQPSIVSERPPEAIRPPDRKSSAVDPSMFGPINSLHGHINTPCGFRPGEYGHARPLPANEPILQTGSASIEARPMQRVYPMPTTDPTIFEAAASSSGVSLPQVSRESMGGYNSGRPGAVPGGYPPTIPYSQAPPEAPLYSRPAPVPIQAPKPRVPVSTRVLEEQRNVVEHRSGQSSDGRSVVESMAPVLVGVAGAAGAAMMADHVLNRDDKYDDRTYDHRDDKKRDERIYDRRDERVYDKREGMTYDKHDEKRDSRYESGRDPRRGDQRYDGRSATEPDTRPLPPSDRREGRDDRQYERRNDKPYDKRESDDRRSRPTSDGKSFGDSVASVTAPTLVGAAGAAIIAGRKDKRETEEREREREREEKRRLREEEERREKEKARLTEEARKLRDDTEFREQAERRIREEREVRYKEERRSHDARDRADRDRALMLMMQEKREREERRQLDTARDDKPREVSADRKKLKKENVKIIDERQEPIRSGTGSSVAIAAGAVAAGAVVAASVAAASEGSSRSDRKRSEKRSDTTGSSSLDPSRAKDIPGKPTKEERRKQRDETRRMLAEIQKEMEREKELARLHDEAVKGAAAKDTPPEPTKQAYSSSSSKDSKGPVDPFQFQVPDDAFQTPIYGSTPARPLTPEIVVVDREPPKFDIVSEPEDEFAERRSRLDEFETAQRRERIRAGDSPKSPDTPVATHGVVSPPAEDSARKREAEPVRDPVLEEANRVYRESKMKTKMVEEEIRSRSASPNPSIVGKWNEEVEDPVVRIVTPPEMKRAAPKKSKFDGPNADVRIDNVIMPRDLERYKAPVTLPHGLALMPVFKSRDPSAERERPMLNLVLPTPRHTPSPEKQRERQRDSAPEEKEGPRPKVVTVGPPGSEDDDATSKSVSWGENDTRRFETESPEPSKVEQVERDKAQEDASDAARASALAKLGKKRFSWGMLAGLAGGAAAGAVVASKTGEDKATEDQDKPTPEPAQGREPAHDGPQEARPSTPIALSSDLDDAPPPQVGRKPSTPNARGKEKPVAEPEPTITPEPTPDDAYVDTRKRQSSSPPKVISGDLEGAGPKPPSPSVQMPGAFGDDIDFTATLAAGLQSSGFDPNIVIDDPTYRRRDSPPGSNDEIPYKPPSSETVTDLGADEKHSASAARELEKDTPVDEWDTPTKSSKKERRKQEKVSGKRQDSRDTDITSRSEPQYDVGDAPQEPESAKEDPFEKKLSKKEQKKLEKLEKAAKALAQEEAESYTAPELQTTVSVDAGEDEWDTPSKKAKKGKKGKQQSAPRSDAKEEDSPKDIEVPEVPKAVEAPPVPEPEDEWAIKDTKKSKKKSKRGSESYDSSTTYSGPASEVSVASSSSKKGKKGRRTSTKDDYNIPEQDEPPDRPGDSFQLIDREVSSVVSEPTSKRSNGSRAGDGDDTRSVVSVPRSADRKKSGKQSDGESSFELVTPTNGMFEDKEDSTTVKENGDKSDEHSFLGNAGTFGAGVGLAGAAVAAIATELSRPTAAQASAQKEEWEKETVGEQEQVRHHQRERSVSYGSQVVDPEIVVQRTIKPAIDPQFGDLLPLPPSEPGSPSPLLADEFPELPESRPDTPPGERMAAAKGHTRRRSAFETPKTPSQTAVPIQFRLGKGSVPSSPAFFTGRASSPGALSSPAMAVGGSESASLGTPPVKGRARPTSWDSSREIKPLYLIEKASSSSLGTEYKHQNYPELPLSDPPSRESPASGFEDESHHRFSPGLMIDTQAAAEHEDILGSQEVTPRASAFSVHDLSTSLAEAVDTSSQEPVANIVPEDALTSSELSRSVDKCLSQPPVLPENRGGSPTQELIDKPQAPTDELSNLPALPESLSSSPVQELLKETAILSEDLSHLPPLPESRSSSASTGVPRIPEPSTNTPTLAEEQTLVASFSKDPYIASPEIHDSYEDLKASLKKEVFSERDTGDTSDRGNSFFIAAAGAAAGGIVVAHMVRDDTPRDLGDLELDKSRLVAPHKAESVLSYDDMFDNASTIAASEAPTSYSLLSGSTFLGQHESFKTKESPRLDRFAFVPPQAKRTQLKEETTRSPQEEQSVETLEDDWAVSGSSKKEKKKSKKGALSWAPEPEAAVAAEESVEQLAAEEKAPTLLRTTSTLKKGKKKSKGGKGVSWTEPAEMQDEITDTRGSASREQEMTSESLVLEQSTKEQVLNALEADVLTPTPVLEPDLPSVLLHPVTGQDEDTATASNPHPAIKQDEAADSIVDNEEGDFFTSASKGKKGKKAKKSKAKPFTPNWEKEDDSKKPEAESSSANVAKPGPADLPEPVSADPIGEQQPHSISPVQQASDQITQEPVSAQDVVPQNSFAPEETSGELAGVHAVEHVALADAKPEDQDTSGSPEQPAASSRDVFTATEAPKGERKGIMSSGFSMLPTMAGVGSFFGLGKRDSKQPGPEPHPEKAEAEEQLTRDAFPVREPPSLFSGAQSEQEQQGSSERIPDVGPLQDVQKPASHDKSLDDTTNSALATAASAPNERVDTPEGSTINTILTGEPLTVVQEPEAIRESELDESSHKQTTPGKDDLTSVAANEDQEQLTDGNNIASEVPPANSMDWDQEITTSKKGKKGKNKRQSTKDESIDAPAPDVASPANHEADVEQAAADDQWGESSGKKGKKGKKDKKKKGTVIEDPAPLVESDMPVGEPEDTKEEPPVADVYKPMISEAPNAVAKAAAEEFAEESWGAPASKKGKKDRKDKKKKGTAVYEDPEPLVEEKEPVAEATEPVISESPRETTPVEAPVEAVNAVSQEAADDLWGAAASKKGKKDKKDKKKKGTTIGEDPEPLVEEPVVDVAEPVMLEPAQEVAPVQTAEAASEEASEDLWGAPASKKGKKDKKKKKQSPQASADIAAVEAPTETDILDVTEEPEQISEHSLVEAIPAQSELVADAATTAPVEVSVDDTWAEPTVKKGKKDKKKRQSVQDAPDDAQVESSQEAQLAQPAVEPAAERAADMVVPGPDLTSESIQAEPEIVLEKEGSAEAGESQPPAQEEPLQEDAWSEPTTTGKKGKTDKKKKQPAWEASDVSPTEPLAEEATVASDQAPHSEPVQIEDPMELAHPVDAAADEQPLLEESVQDDSWGALPAPKKGKKDKKKKKQLDREASDTVPEPPFEEAATATEETLPGEPAQTEDLAETSQPEDSVADEQPAPEEPVQDDPFEALPTSKKGKKDKKKKKQASFDPEVLAETPVEEMARQQPMVADSLPAEVLSEQPQVSDAVEPITNPQLDAQDVSPEDTPAEEPQAESSQDSIWAEPVTAGKKSKKNKKGKGASQSTSWSSEIAEEPVQLERGVSPISSEPAPSQAEANTSSDLVPSHTEPTISSDLVLSQAEATPETQPEATTAEFEDFAVPGKKSKKDKKKKGSKSLSAEESVETEAVASTQSSLPALEDPVVAQDMPGQLEAPLGAELESVKGLPHSHDETGQTSQFDDISIQETHLSAKDKKKKKKRQSVSFAYPLEEHQEHPGIFPEDPASISSLESADESPISTPRGEEIEHRAEDSPPEASQLVDSLDESALSQPSSEMEQQQEQLEEAGTRSEEAVTGDALPKGVEPATEPESPRPLSDTTEPGVSRSLLDQDTADDESTLVSKKLKKDKKKKRKSQLGGDAEPMTGIADPDAQIDDPSESSALGAHAPLESTTDSVTSGAVTTEAQPISAEAAPAQTGELPTDVSWSKKSKKDKKNRKGKNEETVELEPLAEQETAEKGTVGELLPPAEEPNLVPDHRETEPQPKQPSLQEPSTSPIIEPTKGADLDVSQSIAPIEISNEPPPSTLQLETAVDDINEPIEGEPESQDMSPSSQDDGSSTPYSIRKSKKEKKKKKVLSKPEAEPEPWPTKSPELTSHDDIPFESREIERKLIQLSTVEEETEPAESELSLVSSSKDKDEGLVRLLQKRRSNLSESSRTESSVEQGAPDDATSVSTELAHAVESAPDSLDSDPNAYSLRKGKKEKKKKRKGTLPNDSWPGNEASAMDDFSEARGRSVGPRSRDGSPPAALEEVMSNSELGNIQAVEPGAAPQLLDTLPSLLPLQSDVPEVIQQDTMDSIHADPTNEEFTLLAQPTDDAPPPQEPGPTSEQEPEAVSLQEQDELESHVAKKSGKDKKKKRGSVAQDNQTEASDPIQPALETSADALGESDVTLEQPIGAAGDEPVFDAFSTKQSKKDKKKGKKAGKQAKGGFSEEDLVESPTPEEPAAVEEPSSNETPIATEAALELPSIQQLDEHHDGHPSHEADSFPDTSATKANVIVTEPAFLAPEEPVKTQNIGTSLNEIPQSDSPQDTPPKDDEAPLSSKSKKDKKKKKGSKHVDSEPVSVPATPVEEPSVATEANAQEPELSVVDAVEPTSEVLASNEAETASKEHEGDDLWAAPSKKAKKDKKRKGSKVAEIGSTTGSVAPPTEEEVATVEERPASVDAVGDDMVAESAVLEELASGSATLVEEPPISLSQDTQPAPETQPEDASDMPMKKSKKGKKEKKRKGPAAPELEEQTDTPAEASVEEQQSAVAEESVSFEEPPLTTEEANPVLEDLPTTLETSKITPECEPQPVSTLLITEREALVPDDTQPIPEPSQTEVQTGEDWDLPVKKKKGKKSKKGKGPDFAADSSDRTTDLPQEPSLSPPSSSLESAPEPLSHDIITEEPLSTMPKEALPVTASTQQEGLQDDELGISTESKDLDSRNISSASLSAEPSSLAEDPSSIIANETSATTEALQEDQAVDMWDVPVKKSKKDKKRKSKLVESEPTSGAATPVIEYPGPSRGSPFHDQEEAVANVGTAPEPALDTPAEAPQEDTQPDDTWGIPAKKSKKEKKRKGSKVADSEPASRSMAPSQEEPSIPEIQEQQAAVPIEEPTSTIDEVTHLGTPEAPSEPPVTLAVEQLLAEESRRAEIPEVPLGIAAVPLELAQSSTEDQVQDIEEVSVAAQETVDTGPTGAAEAVVEPPTPEDLPTDRSIEEVPAAIPPESGTDPPTTIVDDQEQNTTTQEPTIDNQGMTKGHSEAAQPEALPENSWDIPVKAKKGKDRKRKGSKIPDPDPETEAPLAVATPAAEEERTILADPVEPSTAFTDEPVTTELEAKRDVEEDEWALTKKAKKDKKRIGSKAPEPENTAELSISASPLASEEDRLFPIESTERSVAVPDEPTLEVDAPVVQDVQEDDWAPTRKAKKGKKRNGVKVLEPESVAEASVTSSTAAPEDDLTLPVDLAEETSITPVDSTDHVVIVADEPTVEVDSPIVHDVQEDEWAPTKVTKKSKKQKGSKAHEVDSTAAPIPSASAPAPEPEHAISVESVEPNVTVADEPTADAPFVQDVQEDEPTATKKPKKDKKRKGSKQVQLAPETGPEAEPESSLVAQDFAASATEEEAITSSAPLVIDGEDFTQLPKVAEPSSDTADADDAWAMPAKPKKGKKGKRQADVADSEVLTPPAPADETPELSEPVARSPPETVEEVVEPTPRAMEPAPDQAEVEIEDSWALPAKKPKKEKKEKKGKRQTPIADYVIAAQAPPEDESLEVPATAARSPPEIIQEAVIEATEPPPDQDEAEDPWALPAKKPKKDKKGKKQLPVADSATAIPTTIDNETSTTIPEPIDKLATQDIGGALEVTKPPVAEAEIEDSWALPAKKKSKKDKKKGKKQALDSDSGAATPTGGDLEIPITSDPPKDMATAAEEDPTSSCDLVSHGAPKDDEWAELGTSKSKKDKKKKGKKTDSESASSSQPPQSLEATPMPDILSPDESSAAKDIGEGDFDFAPMKPKKDKKKRKSLALAPEDDPSSFEEPSMDMVKSTEPDDYFQAKIPGREQPSVDTLHFHPAISLPTVGLGLITDPPVLYPSDAPSPKLLTSLMSPIIALEDDSCRPLVPIESPGASQPEDHVRTQPAHVQHEPPFDYEAHRKKAKTRELEATEVTEPVISAREIAASFLEGEHKHGDDAVEQAPYESVPPEENDEPSRQEARELAASFLEEDPHNSTGKTPVESVLPATKEEAPNHNVENSRGELRELAASFLETGTLEPIAHAEETLEPYPAEPSQRESREVAASFLEGAALPPSHSAMDVDVAPREDIYNGTIDRSVAREAAASFLEKESHDDRKKEKSVEKPKNKSVDADDVAAAAAVAGGLTGGVALLAQKFGGSTPAKKKKGGKKSKIEDKRTVREDDLFDDEVLWEGSEKRPLEGSRMESNADGFWDVPADDGDVDKMEVDAESEVMQKGAEVHGVPVTERVEVREEPRMQESGLGIQVPVVESAREVISEEEPRNASSRSEGLSRQDSETVPKAVREGLVQERNSKEKKRERRGRERSESPEPVQRSFSFPDDIADEEAFSTRELKNEGKKSKRERTAEPTMIAIPRVSSISDFMRTVSNLPPVQEEASSEDEPVKRQTKATKHSSRGATATPEPNRDSGFGSDSPHASRRVHAEGLRDSGVHLESTPKKQRESYQSSHSYRTPTSTSASTSRGADDNDTERSSFRRSPLAGDLEEKSANASTGASATPRKLVGPETPRFREPDPTSRTPEPEKLAVKKKRAPAEAAASTLAPPSIVGAAATGAAAGAVIGAAAASRSVSDSQSRGAFWSTPPDPTPRRSASNTSLARLRTPEPFRPDSPGSLRSYTGTPPLRRADRRVSGDLRSVSLSQRDLAAKAKTDEESGSSAAAIGAVAAGAAALGVLGAISASKSAFAENTTPNPVVANEGRVRTKDMTDVYDGYGEGRIGSPRSPTRPHSMRRRQSMQVLELESRVDQLLAENRALAEARAQAEASITHRNATVHAERDSEIESLKRMLHEAQDVIERLKQTNDGLRSSTSAIAVKHHEEVRRLENEHSQTSRELEQVRAIASQHIGAAQSKDAELADLRVQLEESKEEILRLQEQILKTTTPDDGGDFLDLHDVDYFDHRCQQLCAHVQQWVLRFSKFSDMRACRLTSEINDEKLIDRLDNAVLDGSDVDAYLNDRVRRRDIFMSMTTTMIWEFVFTRYLFGMDREQRQKLKTLEKQLTDVGPPHAVRQWRAVTLTLLSRRPSFKKQRDQDTEAVVQAILDALGKILPPPSNLEDQIQTQLKRVVREAVGLAIEMRCQKAEYMMLPPLQPEYDDTGELTETVQFNAALMNERSGDSSLSNEDLEAAGTTVRVVLFPLVVRKGDENGVGEDEIVVCPAQVLVAKPLTPGKKTVRMVTPSSDAGGVSLLARSPGPGSTRAGGSVSGLGTGPLGKSDVSMNMDGSGF